MCCAIVALTMTLLAGWRSLSSTFVGRIGRLRRVALALIAIAAAAGSVMAADRFAQADSAQLSLLTPICGVHFIR